MRTRVLAAAALAALAPLAAAQTDGLVGVPGFPAAGIPGPAAFARLGQSVASAGDVNGDGYADVIAGAPGVNGSAGRATVYFGGPLASSTPGLMLAGAASGDLFGTSVAGAGDVNGDGYDDLIVGAPGHDAGGFDTGRATVYFGGAVPNATPDLTLAGVGPGGAFGIAVAGAGDVNGDGFADVAVGAFNAASTGRAYVYFGGAAPDAAADLTMLGAGSGSQFGTSLAGAGDVDGDGYDDLVVGAPQAASSAGRAYVYLGGAAPNPIADLTLAGAAAGDAFGYAVAGAGDVNGDGFADVAVGAPFNDAGSPEAGRVTVYFGGTTLNAGADLTLVGSAVDDYVGYSVAGAGDVNGDGFADLVVGARLADTGGVNSGRVEVYFGGTAPDTVADVVLAGSRPGDALGYAVAGAGDVDGDGLPDLVLGAPEANRAAGTDAGVVYVVSNANTGAGLAEWRALGAAVNDQFGQSISSGSDVNGDGYDDLVVGAPYNSSGSSVSGSAYVYFGGPGADRLPDLTLTNGAAGGNFGNSVAGVGDVNGDGYGDVLVGAPYSGGTGRAYLYLGGAVPNALPDATFTGEAANDNFGFSVAGAGDVNGDGYADLVVGAHNADGPVAGEGRAYVYYGGAVPNATPDLTLTGTDAEGRFGYAVAGAGDVNGDGYADVVVGATYRDAAGTNAGRAYLYFGGVLPDALPDATFTGEAANDNFGFSVAGAGDVDGDGYGDVLVGALGSSAAAASGGRAYLFAGSPVVDATPDLVVTGLEVNGFLGAVVGGMGDINGDGYDDVAIGAPGSPATGAYGGRASVYYGGPGIDAQADLTVAGEAAEDYLGLSVALAGDLNGDGRADLAVGAFGVDSYAGAVTVYRATGPAAAPSLYRLADVPGDQGGVVQLRWSRSDAEAQSVDVSYLVERSQPAGSGGYAWEPVATLAANGNPRYSLAAATYSDQTAGNSGVTCFRVTAKGADGQLWRSTVRCGASIDNLAPAAPPALAVAASGDGDVLVRVTALASPPPDLAGYRVTRSLDAVCDAADVLVGTAPDTGAALALFEDDATDFGTDVFYCAAAVDVHGNASAVVGAATANPAVLAAVRVILQGAYQAGLPGGALMRADLEDALPLSQPYGVAPFGYTGTEAIPATDESPANGRPDLLDAYDVVDWVLVEVRSSPTATDGLRAAALLLADGTLLDPSTGTASARVRPAAAGAYHVAVVHRTHLAAMSVFAIGLSGAGANAAFDFTLSPSLVYGTDAVADLGGVYGLFAGDGDASGTVLAPDRQSVWLPQVGQTGYRPGDYDLDGSVLANDLNTLLLPNVGRQSAVPGAASRPPAPPEGGARSADSRR